MNAEDSGFIIREANEDDIKYSTLISSIMEESAKARGTGIGKRSPQVIAEHIREKRALLAFSQSGQWAGFCYMNLFDNGAFVSNSGLIVAVEFREHGLATLLKTRLFELCRKRYPNASIVGITTSAAVMKINTELGFTPTSFAKMPKEEKFWKGCEMCVNHDILRRTSRKYCLCTAMHFKAREETISPAIDTR
jgi:hypothetical protein